MQSGSYEKPQKVTKNVVSYALCSMYRIDSNISTDSIKVTLKTIQQEKKSIHQAFTRGMRKTHKYFFPAHILTLFEASEKKLPSAYISTSTARHLSRSLIQRTSSALFSWSSNWQDNLSLEKGLYYLL